ncbi:MAG: hypothetical protein O7G84_13875 [Gammaproteobacteria bacterium]|nr:hypothetical protein [Gammaproteobacteria bacterium]
MAMTINMTTLHRYERGKLHRAMAAMSAEAEKVVADGYELAGYQVVAEERCIVTLYKRVARRTPTPESALVGE